MSLTEWWNDPTIVGDSPKPPKTSKVDKFKKNNIDDGTKVGGIEQAVIPKVAGAIESAGKKPVLGRIINPAMDLLGFLGEKIVQPATQTVSAALLTPQAMAAGKGGLTESYRYAKKKAEKISMGRPWRRSLPR